jgi:MFS family permease
MKKIPRQVLYLSVISLFTDMASEMLYPVTPIFLSTVLGASMAVVGLIEGFAEITAGLLKGYFGILSDKIRKRSVFVSAGYALSALSKPLPGIFPSVAAVIGARVTDRIGKGIRTAPRDALLASYSENNSGAIFGFHRAMDTLGAVAGPLLAILLLNLFDYDYQLIFILAFVPSLVAVAFTLTIKDKKIETTSASKSAYSLAFIKKAPRQYKILLVLITAFSLVNSSDVFLILKSREISNSATMAIVGYVFYNFVYAASSYPAGLAADKFGKKNLFAIGLFIYSFVYFGFASFNLAFLTWVLFALYGIYAAFTEVVLKAWISDLIEDNQRGTAIGILTMFSSFAVLIGSFLAGVLWDLFGSAVPFYLTSIVSFIVAALVLYLSRGKR